MNKGLRKDWEKPDAQYMLDKILKTWGKKTCTAHRRAEFARAVHKAWFLFTDHTQNSVRRILEAGETDCWRKKRSKNQAPPLTSYEVYERLECLAHVDLVAKVWEKLHASASFNYTSMKQKRMACLHDFNHQRPLLTALDIDILCGFLVEFGAYQKCSDSPAALIALGIKSSNSIEKLQIFWDYLKCCVYFSQRTETSRAAYMPSK